MRGGVRKRGTKWAAFWDLPSDERRQGTKSGFATKREAQAYLAEQLAAIRRGEYVEPDRSTLGDWFDTWSATAAHRLKQSTLDKYRRDFERYVRPTLGNVKLQALRPVHLDSLYRSLLDGTAKRAVMATGRVSSTATSPLRPRLRSRCRHSTASTRCGRQSRSNGSSAACPRTVCSPCGACWS